MEDFNTIAADCVVISCCCQCLILQLLIFFVIKFPRKLFRKTRDYAKKLRDRKRRKILKPRIKRSNEAEGKEGFFMNGNSHGFGCCMEEVEKVLEEFSVRGNFGFGSFWNEEIAVTEKFPFPSSWMANKEIDYDVVHCHLIEIFGSDFNSREE